MHKVFSLGDVVCEIVAYLEKAALISFSQTCRTLSSSALDALWCEMTSLDPLYQTLPNGVWTKDDEGKLILGPSTPTTSKDWERFLTYARRIRGLSFADDTSELRPDFLTLMTLYLPSLPALPRLRSLRISRAYPDTELVLCLTTLAHPGLHTLNIASTSSAVVVAILSHVQYRCPDIRNLSISKASGLLPLVSRFTRLQKLVLDDPESELDMHTLSALACFPYLRHLSVTSRFTSETFSIVGKDNFKDEERFFPSLEELLLGNVTGVLALANLLSLIPPTALRTISVTYSLSQHPAKELRRLAENIALHPHICVLSLRSREPTVDAVKATDISILQNLKGLRAVYLDDVLSFTTAECGIFGLVQHWPDVRTVHIDCTAWREGGWGECRVFSLGILGDILYKCPRLEQFHAAMRAVDLPARAPSRVRQRYQGPLRLSVDITSSSFDLEPYDVAESLTSIRPGIEIICDGDALFVEEWRNKWIEVNKWAGRINATRAAEREGIESELLEVIGPEAEAQIVADAEDLS